MKGMADRLITSQDVVMVFMEALGLEPPLTLVCSDLHLEREGYRWRRGRRSRSRCCRKGPEG
jgi:hypothetical protein